MQNAARVNASLQFIGPLSQRWTSQPTTFQADVASAGGPTPGEILASLVGTDVNLSQLTVPGLCWLFNLGVDASGNDLSGDVGDQANWTNYVEWGAFDSTLNKFLPLGELLPDECCVLRLSRFLGEQFGTGSGTAPGADAITLRIKSIGTASKVVVCAFER